MRLETTIVDGIDLEIEPMNFSADPIKRTAVGRGLLGLVHFLWPAGQRTKLLTVEYEGLSVEEARRLMSALGPATPHNKTLEFARDGELFVIPGRVGLRMTIENGRANATLTTVVRSLMGGVM